MQEEIVLVTQFSGLVDEMLTFSSHLGEVTPLVSQAQQSHCGTMQTDCL